MDQIRPRHMTGIIPSTYFNTNSSNDARMRANALVKGCKDFEVWKHGAKYDNLIFANTHWPEMMTLFKGPMVLDMCDVDLAKFDDGMGAMTLHADAISCSTRIMEAYLKDRFPGKAVHFVPNRLDFGSIPPPRSQHTTGASSIVWLAEKGDYPEVFENLGHLLNARHIILKIIAPKSLTIDDRIIKLKPEIAQYNKSTVFDHIKSCDILISNQSGYDGFQKDLNMISLLSWKLGVPVAQKISEVENLLDPQERNVKVESMSKVIDAQYNVRKSVAQYYEIFDLIRNKGNAPSLI